MLQDCVTLNGKVINVGPWDYRIEEVEIEPAQFDEDGNLIKEAVLEEQITNPLPAGAIIEQMEVSQNADGGYKAESADPTVQLENAKQSKIAEIKQKIGEEITSGYQSNVVLASTGKAHVYGTQLEDQANMTGEYAYMNEHPEETTVEYRPQDMPDLVNHTRDEFKQIAEGFRDFVKGWLRQGYDLCKQAQLAETVDAVNAITV